MGTVLREFNGTCIPVYYPCPVGDRYLDPCDCTHYYVCGNAYSIIRVSCAPGTAFDHTSSTAYCRGENEVILSGICDMSAPWDRCENLLNTYMPTRSVDDVERRCKDGGLFTTTAQPQKEDDEVDGGAIAGAVIAVLLIIALVVLVVIYVRRKGNPLKHLKQTRFWQRVVERRDTGESPRSTRASPRYAGYPSATAEPTEEETYTEIDDTAMYKNPGSRKSSAAGRTRISSHTNAAYDKNDVEEGVAYDNPAHEPDTPPLNSSRHPAPPPYTELDGVDGKETSNNPLAKRPSLVTPRRDTVSEPAEGDDGYLVAHPFDQSGQSESPERGPYFELEAENSC